MASIRGEGKPCRPVSALAVRKFLERRLAVFGGGVCADGRRGVGEVAAGSAAAAGVEQLASGRKNCRLLE